jgi:hypothetical protein
MADAISPSVFSGSSSQDEKNWLDSLENLIDYKGLNGDKTISIL